MANTLYANTESSLVSTGGGQAGFTTVGSAAVQVNSGTSVPCKVVYINAVSADAVTFSISSSLNVSLGCIVPTVSVLAQTDIHDIEVPIDDASKLWFYCVASAVVHITYRL